ncbi:MAG: YidC/Oxa1 family membrane protein insertase [bacterium]|nr:YidC/Oxa1 family membrane protein insertase [bacterium]
MGDKAFNFARFFLIFALVYFLTEYAMGMWGIGKQKIENNTATDVRITMMDKTVKGGHHPIATIINGTNEDIVLEDTCPMPPLQVFFSTPETGWSLLETEETAIACTPLTLLPAGSKTKVDLGPWKYSMFSEYGDYELRFNVPTPDALLPTPEPLTVAVEMYPAGSLTKIFRAFITKPFLAFLIFVASLFPDHNLGIAIVLLTLVVKLALFFPTQHALEGQKKLQKLQPKLDELRKKHKDNPERMNKEIMKLWQDNNVNPMQSCLPMLVQFPVLIGLFFVIRDGSVLELSREFTYSFHQNIDWSFGMNFLGLDLSQPNVYFMPPALMVLQFFQMKLSFANAKKKQEDSGKKKPEPNPQQEMQQRMMLYGLPLMIGFFAIKFPAAVSLYWLVSTMFGIVQQHVVNKRTA